MLSYYSYPDTLLSTDLDKVGILKPQGYLSEPFDDLKEEFKSYPSDTLSVFFIHIDTVEAYEFEEIAADYNILARYDISYQDLERLNFTITYPPDESSGLKMFVKE